MPNEPLRGWNSHTNLLAAIQEMLRPIADDLNELKKSLPETYVTIRNHEVALSTLIDRISQLTQRVITLEEARTTSMQWAADEHSELRQEWQQELKETNTNIGSLKTEVLKMSEHLAWLNHILVWLLGLFTTLGIGVTVAYITHFLH